MVTDQTRRPVVNAFESREHADRALTNLRGAGFKDDEIGWAMRHEEAPEGTKDVSGDVAGGATAGAVTGGILGAAGAAAGMALIPGIGPFIAGGYLATILTTAGVSAAAGGVLGGLAGAFGDEDEKQFYEDEFKAGRPIMTVNHPERRDEASEILRSSGGYDYASRRTTTSTTSMSGGAPAIGTGTPVSGTSVAGTSVTGTPVSGQSTTTTSETIVVRPNE